jgi:hypothetical protein
MDRRVGSIETFLRLVAGELGGRVRVHRHTLDLLLPDRQVAIEATNRDGPPSRGRLEYVEQKAAIALLAVPALFGAAVAGRSPRGKRSIVLRVAFGFRLLARQTCFRRYTSYIETGTRRRWTIRGDDDLFAEDGTATEAPPDTSQIAKHLGALAAQISDASEDYLLDPDTSSAVAALAERLKSELFELDLLYNRRSQRHVRSYGLNPEKPSRAFDSPALEFERKKMIVHQRHAARATLHVLSVGTVTTPVAGTAEIVRLPFLRNVSADRWISSRMQKAR